MFERYNLEKLIKVVVNDETESYIYEYRDEKKFLWFIMEPKGIYNQASDDFIGTIDDLKYHYLKDGIVYQKPYVELIYQDNIKNDYYFETFEQAKRFANMFCKGDNWTS